ncbi:hypothetical protein RB653_005182 [Dictyostelium firmibasis]|uniref:COP9 signalosome complex subunit 3 n=1 Tax=Dictyostelium firmibasis TaxID=79012 RepID=A0AAN7U0V0_9MYCE
MDSFVLDAQNPNPKNLKNLLKYEEQLERQLVSLDNILGALDVRNHSLGQLLVLKAKGADQNKNRNTFIDQCNNFFRNCNFEQVRIAPAQFSSLSKFYTEALFEVRQPIRGVAILKEALNILSDNKPTSNLTPIHTDFLQLCILSKCYHQALPLIESNITHINPEQSSIAIKDILCYFYYSGIIFTALKKYKKAIEAFKFVITAPASALSAIAVEAYKKYLIVNLIQYGTTQHFPRCTPAVVQRNIKSHCKPYTEFVQSFSNGSLNDIINKSSSGAEFFQKDNNWGLVKLSIKSIHRRNIKKLTQTFMTLSISDIAEKVNIPKAKAEQFVLKMIEEGEIFATINQKDGMVTFDECFEDFSGPAILNDLDRNINNIVSLESKIKDMDEKISLSNGYLKKLASGKGTQLSQYEDPMEDIN